MHITELYLEKDLQAVQKEEVKSRLLSILSLLHDGKETDTLIINIKNFIIELDRCTVNHPFISAFLLIRRELLTSPLGEVRFKYMKVATGIFAKLLGVSHSEAGECLYKSDYYTDIDHCIARLLYEFECYKKLVVAVDFDDTLYDFHGVGRKYTGLVSILKQIRPYIHLIVFTSRDPKDYDFVNAELCKLGLQADSINEPAPFMSFKTGKLYANLYVDDRGGLPSVYKMLQEFREYLIENEYC